MLLGTPANDKAYTLNSGEAIVTEIVLQRFPGQGRDDSELERRIDRDKST